MRKSIGRGIILILMLLLTAPLYSQGDGLVSDTLINKLQTLSSHQTSEQVYIQASKDIYETEENVWFKGYVLNAQYFTSSQKSNILFVQLINDKSDEVVWEEKYEIENGFVNGHLFLDKDLELGNYTLAAYTAHSFDSNTKEFYAIRKLKVVKRIDQYKETKKVQQDTTIHFNTFPEGGYLVSGIESKLAFKVLTKSGMPKQVSGTLFEDNVALLDFNSTHVGMGAFVFTPNKDKKYHIKIVDAIFDIPEIKPVGISMRLLVHHKDTLLFKISKSPELPQQTIYVRLQIRGEVYNLVKLNIKNSVKIKIPTDDLPQGIVEVAVFNESLEPVCERLVYIKNEQRLHIKTVLNNDVYKTRDKVQLKIKVTDENGQPIISHLGLSIYDKVYQNPQNSKNILTHYYLSTQLKGNIYDPSYYFNTKNTNRKEALELLLLTQGWRRYIWNETNLIENNKDVHQILFEEIKGTIKTKARKFKKNELPAAISLYNADNKGALISTDSLGDFIFKPPILRIADKSYIYYNLVVKEHSNLYLNVADSTFKTINNARKSFKINYPFSKLYMKTIPPRPFVLTDDITELDEVLIKGRKENIHRSKFFGKLDSMATFDRTTDYVCSYDNVNCPNHPPGFGNKTTKPIEGEMYYEKNKGLTPYQYTKNHNFSEEELLKMFNIKKLKGFYGTREFYQPIYDKETIKDPFPDYRNTLFWKPDIITNENGEATVEFFCSDLNVPFVGVIEGIGGLGLLGNDTFEFVVRKRN